MQGNIQYRPRSLFIDLSGSLGGVSLTSSTADAVAAGAASVATWGGPVHVHHAERVPKSGFLQRLDELAELDGTESGEIPLDMSGY